MKNHCFHRGAKATYWQGGVRGNGFIWSPLIEKPGRVINGLMHITDWLPTILHLANGSPTNVSLPTGCLLVIILLCFLGI